MYKKVVFSIFLSVVLSFSFVQANQIVLDHIDGSWFDAGNGDTLLIPNCDVTFYLRLVNDGGNNVTTLTNGFKIWTIGGTGFTPPTADTLPVDFGNGSSWGNFTFGFYINYYSCDGVGTDTVGFSGADISNGIPNGFNEVAFKIHTGGIQGGETLCLDSSYFPPAGEWIWAGTEAPNWSGPYCYQASMPPCLFSQITNCPDTITVSPCDTALYDFNASDPQCFGDTTFVLINGPGMMDSITGEWSYAPQLSDIGTTQNLTVAVYEGTPCLENQSTTVLKFIESRLLGDINQDCKSNVNDLMFLINYMFISGPQPPVFELADVDGSGTLNISDLIYFANYMFTNGPPPVNPWP